MIEEDNFYRILRIADILLPGKPEDGLPSASDVLIRNWNSNSDLEFKSNAFIEEYFATLEHEVTPEDLNESKLLDYLDKGRHFNSDFLNTLLSLYYSDERVQRFYPDFSGVVFPNSRKMPLNSLEILEPVVLSDGEKET